MTLRLPRSPWPEIDHALLDLDGTLLDKYFDDYFWEELLPQTYASENDLSFSEAKARLYDAYKSEEGNLNWTDVDFWSRKLEIDVHSLKEGVTHLIRLHADVEPFLAALREQGKKIFVVTNAHPKTVALKLPRTVLSEYLDGLLCADEVGLAKEQEGFWERAQKKIGFDPERAFFVDDNENVLVAAQRFGIRYLVFRGLSSSRGPSKNSLRFPTIESLDRLI
jgi:HAD superfamily hydrolase (TIGR01509 family)